MFPFPAHPNTLDEYSTHLYWGFCAEDRARPDERNIYLWKASPNVGHKSSKQIKWDARPNVFHICENNKVESGRKVYVSSPRTILPKVLSFNPPQIKPSTDSSSICEYAALTERVAKPLTAPCGLARNTARRDEQEFPPTVLLRAWARSEGCGRATARHRWERGLAPHLPLPVDPSSGARLAASSQETRNLYPHRELLHGRISASLL